MKILESKTYDLDGIDARILGVLAANARIAMSELARQVGLSAPSVSERVKRLEEAGVITGYSATISPAAIGRPIAVMIRIRPLPGMLETVAATLRTIPEITECDRVTGEDCFLARACLRSVADLERVIDQIIPNAMTNTAIVQSSPIQRRLPPLRRTESGGG